MKKKKPEIRLTVKTDKFSFVEETNCYHAYDRLCKRIKKEYGATDVYLHKNKIIVAREEVVGTWKAKRIDGVKI
jgi:hypothetical protein